MASVQKDGSIQYAFNGRFALAQAEALRTILTHEKIPFTVGVGSGYTVIEVDRVYGIRVREVVQQWYEALHVVHKEVWSD